jgi:hypothetical protein
MIQPKAFTEYPALGKLSGESAGTFSTYPSGLLKHKSETLFFVLCILSQKRTNVRYLLLDEIYMYSNHIEKLLTSNVCATRMEMGRTMFLIQPLETPSLPNFSFKTQKQNGNTRRYGAEFLISSHEPS